MGGMLPIGGFSGDVGNTHHVGRGGLSDIPPYASAPGIKVRQRCLPVAEGCNDDELDVNGPAVAGMVPVLPGIVVLCVAESRLMW